MIVPCPSAPEASHRVSAVDDGGCGGVANAEKRISNFRLLCGGTQPMLSITLEG
jgi:hypothetical protein